jgi:hypothetical protein
VLTLFADLHPLAAVFLGVGVAGLVSIPALLFADAHRSDFDPRPAVRRAVESGRFDRLLVAAGPVRHDASRVAARARTTLHALLHTSPEGAIR